MEKATSMSSQTPLGRVTASWVALLMSWLGFGLIKPQARGETLNSNTHYVSTMYEQPKPDWPALFPATQREGSGFCFIPTMLEPSSKDLDQWADDLRSRYGIAQPMENE